MSNNNNNEEPRYISLAKHDWTDEEALNLHEYLSELTSIIYTYLDNIYHFENNINEVIDDLLIKLNALKEANKGTDRKKEFSAHEELHITLDKFEKHYNIPNKESRYFYLFLLLKNMNNDTENALTTKDYEILADVDMDLYWLNKADLYKEEIEFFENL